MKYISLTVLVLWASCASHMNQGHTLPSDKMRSTLEEIKIDLLLEPNTPDSLDLSTHQLFIDTTRDSRYYRQIEEWKPSPINDSHTNLYVQQSIGESQPVKVDLKAFPRDWIEIHALSGTYVAYHPVNGIDRRIILTDSSVNYYQTEADADAISNVVKLTDKELILELRLMAQKSPSQRQWVRIKQTSLPFLYTIQYADSPDFPLTKLVRLITPMANLREFDLVVSDAPVLVHASVEFDRILRQSVE